MDFDLADHADSITELVRDASMRSLDWFRRNELVVDNKLTGGDFDPVTEADRSVEREIRAGLLERFPDHAVLGEEDGESGTGRFRWVIDPIDGTKAFISGQPMWGTLVGFQVDGLPVAGWMHVPVLDETYVALNGDASFIRGGDASPLRTSSTERLSEAIVMCTHPSMFTTSEEIAAFGRIDAGCRMVRYSGDCVNYGLVASGDADLVVETKLQPYDIMALIPIVEAAGGVITNLDGDRPVDGGWAVAAANPALHAEALAALKDDPRPDTTHGR